MNYQEKFYYFQIDKIKDMIDKRELRFENLVYNPVVGESRVIEIGGSVAWLYDGKREGVYQIDYINILPIPLTEQWLIKLGFEDKSEDTFWYGKYVIKYTPVRVECKIEISTDGEDFRWIEGNTIVQIEHVHQLQNLFFALTGKELNTIL